MRTGAVCCRALVLGTHIDRRRRTRASASSGLFFFLNKTLHPSAPGPDPMSNLKTSALEGQCLLAGLEAPWDGRMDEYVVCFVHVSPFLKHSCYRQKRGLKRLNSNHVRPPSGFFMLVHLSAFVRQRKGEKRN